MGFGDITLMVKQLLMATMLMDYQLPMAVLVSTYGHMHLEHMHLEHMIIVQSVVGIVYVLLVEQDQPLLLL